MKLLRKTIRRLILENQKAVPEEVMHAKIEDWVTNKCKQLGCIPEINLSEFPSENIFTGQWMIDGLKKDTDFNPVLEEFKEWFRRRGWNVLYGIWNFAHPEWGIGHLHITADKQPNPKSSNKKWSLGELGANDYVLLHVTTKENWSRIKRKGFVPRSQSSDGVEYGAQRNYFFTMAGSDWNDNQENIMNWFRKMFAEDKRGRMAGLDAKSDLVLIKIDTYAYEARNIVANFYIDTEFGFGSGGVETRGLGFDMEAIYTPTHIPIIPYAVRAEEL